MGSKRGSFCVMYIHMSDNFTLLCENSVVVRTKNQETFAHCEVPSLFDDMLNSLVGLTGNQ